MNRDDEIFAAAIELPAAERAALLARACADDPALRDRVAALLAGYEPARHFLEHAAVDRVAPVAEEKPGDTIGHYTLLRQVGEGGCGVVYLAEQKSPVRRQVALKIIKLGMDTRRIIARFEAERQALALMDHADIARVFDAGATGTGRPFFVMEFVDGVPITKFCDAHRLPLPARLELFMRVCQAVQHAHQKGIIHRDLKPSNILVALRDGVPTPKVIDFGIAKATQGRLTESTLVTAVEQFIGTPAYMSPEQAELGGLDVDTRSDIYSLGVLLYELLTGRTPFETDALLRIGLDEMRRQIREVEPPRPSTRLHMLAAAKLATAAADRQIAPPKLIHLIEGDLDWIAMRCLEKDRTRRYETATDLAQDLARHLNHEPVEARPVGALYRWRKMIRRHRLAFGSAVAVAAVLVLGIATSTWQALRATRAEHAATTAGGDALRRQEQAEDLLTFMLGDFRTELQKIGRLQLLDAVGEKAMAYFAALNPRDLTDTTLARRARALTQIGQIRMDEGRYPDALAAFTAAHDRAAALVARHPQDGNVLFERAKAEFWISFVARRRGDLPAERAWLMRYRDSTVALVALEGQTPRARGELAWAHHNLATLDLKHDRLAEARSGFLAEQTVLETLLVAQPGDHELRYRLANIAAWLAQIAERQGDYAGAIGHLVEMSSRYEELVRLEPAVARWQLLAAQDLEETAKIKALLGQRVEAVAAYARAQKLLDDLVAQDSTNRQWQAWALFIQLQWEELMLAGNEISSAQPLLAETRRKLEALVAAEPSSTYSSRVLAKARRLDAALQFAARSAGAADTVAHALDLGEATLKKAPADGMVIGEVAQSSLLAGRIALAEGRPELAHRHWTRALAVVTPRLPNSNDWLYLDPAAQAFTLLGQPGQARPLIEQLHRFGYHALDPLAASLLDKASLPAAAAIDE